jgi:hypothetical protein
VVEVIGLGTGAIVAYFVMPLDGPWAETLAVVLVAGAAILLVPLALRRAGLVLRAENPLLIAIQSLFTLLTLLVVSFSTVYYVLATQTDDQVSGIETKLDGVYFTMTILSTVGFGDITATGQWGRAAVTINMIVNLVLVAVALRLFSWALNKRELPITSRLPRAPDA